MDVGLLAAIAGFGASGNFIESEIAKEMSMIDVNCKSVIEQSHHYGNIFKNKRRGGIILMSSLQGVPRAANYAATKAFIETFAEGLFTSFALLVLTCWQYLQVQ